MNLDDYVALHTVRLTWAISKALEPDSKITGDDYSQGTPQTLFIRLCLDREEHYAELGGILGKDAQVELFLNRCTITIGNGRTAGVRLDRDDSGAVRILAFAGGIPFPSRLSDLGPGAPEISWREFNREGYRRMAGDLINTTPVLLSEPAAMLDF